MMRRLETLCHKAGKHLEVTVCMLLNGLVLLALLEAMAFQSLLYFWKYVCWRRFHVISRRIFRQASRHAIRVSQMLHKQVAPLAEKVFVICQPYYRRVCVWSRAQRKTLWRHWRKNAPVLPTLRITIYHDTRTPNLEAPFTLPHALRYAIGLVHPKSGILTRLPLRRSRTDSF